MPTLVIKCSAEEFLEEFWYSLKPHLKDGWYVYDEFDSYPFQWWILK